MKTNDYESVLRIRERLSDIGLGMAGTREHLAYSIRECLPLSIHATLHWKTTYELGPGELRITIEEQDTQPPPVVNFVRGFWATLFGYRGVAG